MAAAASPSKGARGKNKMVWIVVCIMGIAAGGLAPVVMGFGKGKTEVKKNQPARTVPVLFGDIVVNLAEERMTRYLRIKIMLLVDEEQEKVAREHVEKHKAELKNWLIAHMAGKSLKDVTGSSGVKRTQREIMERFDEMLYPDGEGHLRDVLFEEFVVQ